MGVAELDTLIAEPKQKQPNIAGLDDLIAEKKQPNVEALDRLIQGESSKEPTFVPQQALAETATVPQPPPIQAQAISQVALPTDISDEAIATEAKKRAKQNPEYIALEKEMARLEKLRKAPGFDPLDIPKNYAEWKPIRDKRDKMARETFLATKYDMTRGDRKPRFTGGVSGSWEPWTPEEEAEIQKRLASPTTRLMERFARQISLFGLDKQLAKLFKNNRDQQIADEAWRRIKEDDKAAMAAGGWDEIDAPAVFGGITNFVAEIGTMQWGLKAIGLLGKTGKATQAGKWLVDKVLGETIKPGMAGRMVSTALRNLPGTTALWTTYGTAKRTEETGSIVEGVKGIPSDVLTGAGLASMGGIIAGIAPPIMKSLGTLYETNRLKYHRVMGHTMQRVGNKKAALAHFQAAKGKAFQEALAKTRAEIRPKAGPAVKVPKIERRLNPRELQLHAEGKTPVEARQIRLAEERVAAQARGAAAGRARFEKGRLGPVKPQPVVPKVAKPVVKPKAPIPALAKQPWEHKTVDKAATARVRDIVGRLKPGETIYISPQFRLEVKGKERLATATPYLKAAGLEHTEELNRWRKPEVLAEHPELAPTAEGKELKAELPAIASEPKNLAQVAVDVARDWPKQIKQVGGDFFAETMDAARKLLTPFRYKELRSFLGVFRHKPGKGEIQLKDITNVQTASHELGHNIDWLLQNKSFSKSIQARFGLNQGERALRAELKAISKIMKPNLWTLNEGKGIPHIRKGSELMADYGSMYILDPAQAKRLAPKITAHYEQLLARFPGIKKIIDRLHKVRDIGPDLPPIAKQIRDIIPLRKHPPRELGIEEPESYVDSVRQLGLEKQRTERALTFRAHVEAQRWRKMASDEKLEDLRVIAEKGRYNLRTGKGRQQIEQELTDQDHKLLRLYRSNQELLRQTVNKFWRGVGVPERIKFLKDYVAHFYDNPGGKQVKNVIFKWAKRTPQAQHRVLPTLEDAVEIGLVPKTHNLADLHEMWANINYKVATNAALLKQLAHVKNPDGFNIIQKPKDAPADWPRISHYALKSTYAHPIPGRGILLWQGSVAVDPEVAPWLNALFDHPWSNQAVRAIEAINALSKSARIQLSFFHHVAELFSAVGGMGRKAFVLTGKEARLFGNRFLISSLKAGEQLRQTPEFVEDVILAGGQTGAVRGEGIRQVGGLLRRLDNAMSEMEVALGAPFTPRALLWLAKTDARALRSGYQWFQRLLWDNVDRLRMLDYYTNLQFGLKAVDKAVRKNPNSKLAKMTVKQVKDTVSKGMQHNYGGIEWMDTALKNPKMFQLARNSLLSIDWTYAQIKKGMEPFSRNPLLRKLGTRHWLRFIFFVRLATDLANLLFAGRPAWDNEKGHKWDVDITALHRLMPWYDPEDKTRQYVGLGKAGRELIGWITKPLQTFSNKMSPVAHIVFEQFAGVAGPEWDMPWRREDLEWYENVTARARAVAEHWVPFSFHTNNAFFALPKRKGMTDWKAIRAYEDIYEVLAKQAMGGVGAVLTKYSPRHADMLILGKDRLFAEIRAASEANEVNWERNQKAAQSAVKTRYYRRFWKAMKDQNVQLANRYADALFALRATPRGFIESAKRREVPQKRAEKAFDIYREAVERGFKKEHELELIGASK